MEKTLLDIESELLNNNTNKKKLLKEMLELEYFGMENSEEYLTKVDLYKRLTSMGVRLIDELDEKEKLKIISHLRRLNKDVLYRISLKDAISIKSDNYLIIQRTIIDLGSELTQLYHENRTEKLKRELVRVCSTYDLNTDMDEDICVPDEVLVNHYMVCDYTNVIYTQINELLGTDILTDYGRLNL